VIARYTRNLFSELMDDLEFVQKGLRFRVSNESSRAPAYLIVEDEKSGETIVTAERAKALALFPIMDTSGPEADRDRKMLKG
jgi:hypothetical protein